MAKAAKSKSKPAGKLRIRMIGSPIGCPERQRATLRGLGLRRMNEVVERLDTPEIRGMVRKIPHLVAVVQGE